ncbi:type II secretion system protein [Beutenbergia cavernae DSM 12333]|uniref:Type II secretion system protein n=1 Tax=Beutenbergia cavernae (strain ATCC BAA-8 / DSM 12333 / CCUG 43141 / JCM 11478 / NBRC 16432 / NCIMB 13614 / HKI 0122) TaxID=471853 RepID=C5BYD5_BEUC1|nr:type II secretion system F family protein [Beutenbergia cavernae]ACQ81035.1 type II secretion system protein [Beutenbergia cavernae DSM 12333]
MGAVAGLLLGAGIVTAWSAWWPRSTSPRPATGWTARAQDELVQAGLHGVSLRTFVGVCLGLGLIVATAAFAVGSGASIAAAFGLIAAAAPTVYVRGRARRRRVELRQVWPDVVDDLTSAVRAGMTLPEALISLSERGPQEVRAELHAFAVDYRASGRFVASLDALKERLADPVADRIVETLRIATDVGGSDLGRMLRTLSEFLRDDLRTRGELEARQSWTVNGARLAVAAPWVVLALMSTRPETAAAFDTPAGVLMLLAGGLTCVVAYLAMMRIGRLAEDPRVLR